MSVTLVFRALGRNPLVRRHDRVEALIMVLGLLVVTCAIPVVISLSRGYSAHITERADRLTRELHMVDATIVEIKPTIPDRFRAAVRSVRVRWDTGVGSADRVETVQAPAAAAVGDRIQVWLDERGAVTSAPPSRADAHSNAITVGVVLWLSVVAVSGVAMLTARQFLNRRRFAAWDDEWELLSARGGGWANRDRVD